MPRRHSHRIAAFAACIAVLATMVVGTSANASGVKAAQTGANPFEVDGQFCAKSTAPEGTRNSSSPGVTPTQITVSDTSLDVDALKRLAGVDQMNFNQAYKAYWDVVNQCGGINGRKVVMKSSLYNVLAPDQAGHLQALCIRVTEDFKSLVNFGTGMPQNQRCVSILHKTISIAAAETPSTDYIPANGRIVSRYPASDQTAEAFVKYGKTAGIFKGHKVGVLSANLPTRPNIIAETKRDYMDELENAGVKDAELEVLPCTGVVCTQGIGPALRRFKEKGVDFVVITHYITVATVGAVFAEFKNQQLKAAAWGPGIDALHSDSNQTGIVRAAGSDAAAYMDKVGWYSTEPILRNGWRLGKVKETPYGKMCTGTLAKQLNQRQYQFNETDINSARWTGTVGICFQVRRVAAAIWSLGNNVTSDRLAAALKNQKMSDLPDTQPSFRTTQRYSGTDTKPTVAFVLRFNYPCPLPTRGPATGACMLAVDRPPRATVIKY
jgi:hypothetical protein